jgi:hypothetical protein
MFPTASAANQTCLTSPSAGLSGLCTGRTIVSKACYTDQENADQCTKVRRPDKILSFIIHLLRAKGCLCIACNVRKKTRFISNKRNASLCTMRKFPYTECAQALASSMSSNLGTSQCELFVAPLCSSAGGSVASSLKCTFMCESLLQTNDKCPSNGQPCTAAFENVSSTLSCPYNVEDEAKKGVVVGKYPLSVSSYGV